MDLSDFEDIQNRIIHVAVSASVGENNTLVAAVSGRQIAVVYCSLFARGESIVRFEDGAGGTALTGQMRLFAKQGTALDPGASTAHLEWGYNPAAWVVTSAGTLLNLEVQTSAVDGVLGYIEW